jgi:hypothetical protein
LDALQGFSAARMMQMPQRRAGKLSRITMSDQENSEALLAAVLAVQRIIEHFGNRGLVIGGVAVSLIGKPRYTADVDAILLFDIDDIASLLETAEQNGLKPRITNLSEFVQQTRVLPLTYEEGKVQVDISLGVLPFEEEAVQRSRLWTAGSMTVRVPTPEDLIILKAIAHRPKDLLDIQTIAETYPDLDRKRIRKWVQEFAEVLEMPELWDDIVPLLKPT